MMLISGFFQSFGQCLNPRDYDDYVWRRFDFTVYNAADLFDSCEIKDRGIRSAALLEVYVGTEARDTLFLYYFDSMGNATTQVCFVPPSLDTEGDSYVRDRTCVLTEARNITGASNPDRYTVTELTPYGAERKTYRKGTDEILDSEFIISRNLGIAFLQTNERSEIITYPFQEGSMLIGKIISIQIQEGYFTSHYVLSYNDR